LERRLDADTTITIEASDVRGVHLPRIRNARGGLPPAFDLELTARSRYRGASAVLHRRLSKELTYLVAYHGGRTFDDASDYDEHPMLPLNTRLDWGISRQHQAHRLAMTALYGLEKDDLQELPAWLRRVLHRVTVSPAFTWGTSRPVNAILPADVYRTGAYPLSARPDGFARNSGKMPRSPSVDLRIMKSIFVKPDRVRLEFGVESFNLFNHTRVVRVSPYYTGTFARPTELAPARQLQLMCQLEY